MVIKAFCLCLIHFFKKSNSWYSDPEKLTEDKYYPLLQMSNGLPAFNFVQSTVHQLERSF